MQAHWTERQGEKLRQLDVQARFEALRARREADLDARRQQLAQKLFEEDVALKNELVSTRETPEQRRAKLADRARALAARREGERQQLAAQLQKQAFMESCDVLRETNSKRILFRTLEERNAQVGGRCARRGAGDRAAACSLQLVPRPQLQLQLIHTLPCTHDTARGRTRQGQGAAHGMCHTLARHVLVRVACRSSRTWLTRSSRRRRSACSTSSTSSSGSRRSSGTWMTSGRRRRRARPW